MTLNDNLSFAAASLDVRRAFRRQTAEKRLLRKGHELYKYTQSPLIGQENGKIKITPWWFSVAPIVASDPGFVGSSTRSQSLKSGAAEFARARGAVSKQWNAMSELRYAKLLTPVYAFIGQCSGQKVDRDDPQQANTIFIGGAWQLWIPDLTPEHIAEVLSA